MRGVRLVQVGLADLAVGVGVGDRRQDGANGRGLARREAVGPDAGEADGGHPRQRRGGDGQRPGWAAWAAAAKRALDEGPGRPGEDEREPAECEHRRRRHGVAEAEAGEGEDRLVPEVGAVADQPDADRGGWDSSRAAAVPGTA